jgi:tetratricopeptide (TPR) repeat protein
MNEKWFERIEDYLGEKMSAEERLLFEQEIAADKELASDFNLYHEIEEEMRDDERHYQNETAFKNSLETLNKIYFPGLKNSTTYGTEPRIHPQTKKLRLWKNISIAAAVTGIIASATLFYLYGTKNKTEIAVNKNKSDSLNQQRPIPSQNLTENKDTVNPINNNNTVPKKNINPEILYAQNFTPEALPEDTEGALENAFDDYSNKKYKKAIIAFNNVDSTAATTRGETDTALMKFYSSYYKAQCYLSIGNADEAVINLKNALNYSTDNYNKIRVNWYLALAYLKTGELQKANDLLTKIAADKSQIKYKRKAQALKEKLNNLIH